jgi:hypothetical protein
VAWTALLRAEYQGQDQERNRYHNTDLIHALNLVLPALSIEWITYS